MFKAFEVNAIKIRYFALCFTPDDIRNTRAGSLSLCAQAQVIKEHETIGETDWTQTFQEKSHKELVPSEYTIRNLLCQATWFY